MSKRKIRRLLDEAKEERERHNSQDIVMWTVGVGQDAKPIGDPIVQEMNAGGEVGDVDPNELPECPSKDCENPVAYPDFGGLCEKCVDRPEETWPSWVE